MFAYGVCFSSYINRDVSKAKLKASQILRCFHGRDPAVLCKAFIVYVRPGTLLACVISIGINTRSSQLSRKGDRAMLRVIEYFAKSLTQRHSK